MNLTAVRADSLVGKMMRLPLRLIPADTQVPILQGPLRGKRWIVGAAQHGYWLGSYEYIMQMTFREKIKPGNVVYDLGANVGFYSLLASVMVGPEGTVFSFEPAPRNLKFLHAHLQMNNIRNCTVWEAAVGRTSGTGNFDFAKDYASGHLTAEPGGMNVRIVGLDELIASDNLPPPNLIKCDIEGAEYDALLGAANTLTMHKPSIFLSIHSDSLYERCGEFLDSLGYVVTPLDYPQDADRMIAANHRSVVERELNHH